MRVRRLRGRGRGHRGGGVGGSLKYLILCLVFYSYEWDLHLVPFCWNRYFLLLFFLSPWLGSQPPHSPGPPGDSPCCHLRTSSFKGKMFIPSCFCSIKTNLLANLKVIATPNFVQNLYYLKEVKTHWSFLLQVFNFTQPCFVSTRIIAVTFKLILDQQINFHTQFSSHPNFSLQFFTNSLRAPLKNSPETDAPRLFSMRLDQCCCLLPLQELLLSQNGVLRVRSETWFPWITWISKLIWTFCPCTLVLPQTL